MKSFLCWWPKKQSAWIARHPELASHQKSWFNHHNDHRYTRAIHKGVRRTWYAGRRVQNPAQGRCRSIFIVHSSECTSTTSRQSSTGTGANGVHGHDLLGGHTHSLVCGYGGGAKEVGWGENLRRLKTIKRERLKRSTPPIPSVDDALGKLAGATLQKQFCYFDLKNFVKVINLI